MTQYIPALVPVLLKNMRYNQDQITEFQSEVSLYSNSKRSFEKIYDQTYHSMAPPLLKNVRAAVRIRSSIFSLRGVDCLTGASAHMRVLEQQHKRYS